MKTAAGVVGVVLLALPMVSGLIVHARGQQQTPQTGAFRSRITLVPVEVRVLDGNGKPVTTLRREDFTILEDGVPQAIGHFFSQALVADASDAAQAARPLSRRNPSSTSLSAQTRRVFLIQMGRGSMQGPSKELPALLSFVRTRLLPQDQVAILAYNRATDFTTDHAGLVTLIERFRDRQEKIEALLRGHFSGLTAAYGSKDIPAHVQREIDAVFEGVSALRPREIRPGQITDAKQLSDDVQKATAELQRAELLAGRTGGFAGLPDPAATETAGRLGLSFDEYVATQVDLMHDVGNLYAGIEYLRHIDGEKHLVFVTPNGISLPRVENTQSIAAVASDARVVLDVLYTGGTVGAAPPRFEGRQYGRPMKIVMTPVPDASSVFRQTFDIQALRDASERTGGQLTAFRSASDGFDRLDRATRHHYLLGYTPTNTAMDGKIRRIAVRAKQPGVTVLYRQSYYATEQLVPLDRRQFVTYSRITAAGEYSGVVGDIEVRIDAATLTSDGEARALTLGVNIRSARIPFTMVGSQHVAAIDIAVYCGDARRQLVCETLEHLELRLSPESYRRFLDAGSTYSAHVRVQAQPAYVKVVAYNYAADIAGTDARKLK